MDLKDIITACKVLSDKKPHVVGAILNKKIYESLLKNDSDLNFDCTKMDGSIYTKSGMVLRYGPELHDNEIIVKWSNGLLETINIEYV